MSDFGKNAVRKWNVLVNSKAKQQRFCKKESASKGLEGQPNLSALAGESDCESEAEVG